MSRERSRTVFRIDRPNKFTTIANDTLRTPNISWKAKGLLAAMLSYPHDWNFNVAHLLTITTDGRDSTYAGIKELIDAGYIERRDIREGGRIVGREMIVRELPAPGKSGGGPTTSGFAVSGKSDTTNTYPKNTKEKPSSTFVDAPGNEPTSSAREASNLPSSLKKGTGSGAALMNELLEIWNQHRGRLPSLRSLSAKRAQLLTRLIKDAEAAKLDPRAVVKAAALEVVNDSHYIQGRYTLENIIQSKSNRLGKLIDKMLEEADPSSSVTFKPGQRVRWLKHRMVPQRGYDYGGVIGEGTNGRTIVAVEDGSPELPHIQIRTDFLELIEDA